MKRYKHKAFTGSAPWTWGMRIIVVAIFVAVFVSVISSLLSGEL